MRDIVIVLIIFFIVIMTSIVIITDRNMPVKPPDSPCERRTEETSTIRLILALIAVESNGNPLAIGDNGQAVGVLQIHPIMVKDVNRILGYEKYTLEDRLNVSRSIEMCRIYLEHYCRNMTVEDKARCWNGGPTGYRKDNTKPYWEKVKAVLYENTK